MVSIATRTSFFVLLNVAVAANNDQPMQSSVNGTASIVASSVKDSSVARDAISALMVETQAVSEMREVENVMYQKRYARETQLADSLLKDVKQSKDLHLTSSLQGIVDEAVMGVEEAIHLEQATQRQYEKTMKSLNSHIQGLGEIAAGHVEQASGTLPVTSNHGPKAVTGLQDSSSVNSIVKLANSTLPVLSNRGRKSAAGLQDSNSVLARGDRVKLLSSQPTWNPPLPIGAEGTVLARLMFQANASFVRVKFDQGITGGLLSKYLQKMQARPEVMV